MSSFYTIKQLEDKNVGNEIDCLVWSDKMDLVAFSNVKGEVALHRLSWTRAWNLSPPKEGVTVKAIAWRPDGKILAVGYSSGEVALICVETKKTIDIKEVEGDITCISWVQEKKAENESKKFTSFTNMESQEYMKHIDLSKFFIKDPQSASLDSDGSNEEEKEMNYPLQQTELNLLLIGTKQGSVFIKIFGCFTCAIIKLSNLLDSYCSVENVHTSEDLGKIFITVKNMAENEVKLVVIDSKIFQTHTKELFSMAMKYVKLMDLVVYMRNTISNITETWESFLLEIDHKLSKYAIKVPVGGISADFLDLLMFGICSPELEEFLMTDLTKKGLEKFGQTIEMSYANIQKLLLKNITKYGQNFTFHLAELKGMARMGYRYGVLGLSEDLINHASLSVGSFLIKAGEMQQIINHSVINYKAFFRWLYGSILYLMEEPIPSEIHKMTQQDLAYITDFLQNFDRIGSKDNQNKRGFVMERLGQYLLESPLSIPADILGNEWTKFLAENECIANHPAILKHYTEASLILQFKDLTIKINDIFNEPKKAISYEIKCVDIFRCFNFGKSRLQTSSINVSKDMLLFSFLEPPEQIHLLQLFTQSDKCHGRYGRFYFPTEDERLKYRVLDIKFYSTSILSILLQDDANFRSAVLYQFSVSSALEYLTELINRNDFRKNIVPCVNGSNLVPKLFKNVEMPAFVFAVSGSRRVSIVLSENRRKVKLFEMEAEEEDDEDAEMSANISKNSIQDSSSTGE